MMKNRILVLVILVLAVYLTGCGIEDKALQLTFAETESVSEDGLSTEGVWSTEDRENVGGVQTKLDDNADVDGSGSSDQPDAVCYVHVCGAVVNPQVVALPEGSRAEDALFAAGGFTEDAHREYVNLASKIDDGQQLYFPTREEAEAIEEARKMEEQKRLAAESGLVNINTAVVEQLCTLPGIGESKALAIINYREQYGAFQKIEDIMQVSGIKQSAYEMFCDMITVE